MLGLVPAFNLLRLGQLFFAALAAYALCRLMGLPRLAAWAGGAFSLSARSWAPPSISGSLWR